MARTRARTCRMCVEAARLNARQRNVDGCTRRQRGAQRHAEHGGAHNGEMRRCALRCANSVERVDAEFRGAKRSHRRPEVSREAGTESEGDGDASSTHHKLPGFGRGPPSEHPLAQLNKGKAKQPDDDESRAISTDQLTSLREPLAHSRLLSSRLEVRGIKHPEPPGRSRSASYANVLHSRPQLVASGPATRW